MSSKIFSAPLPVSSNKTVCGIYEGHFSISLSVARQEATNLEQIYYDDIYDEIERLVQMTAVVCVGADTDVVRAAARRLLDDVTPFGFEETYALAVFVGREMRDAQRPLDDMSVVIIARRARRKFTEWKLFERGSNTSLEMLTRERMGTGFPSPANIVWKRVRSAWEGVQKQFPRVPTALFTFDTLDGVIVMSTLRLGMVKWPQGDAEWEAIDPDAVDYVLRRYVACVLKVER